MSVPPNDSGNPWTTLCPAPTACAGWTPGELVGARKGWACLLFDTYVSDAYSASQAVVGERISDRRWVTLGAGSRALGLQYDKTNGGTIWLKVHLQGCVNEGVGGGRSVDCDRVTPNGENDEDWIF